MNITVDIIFLVIIAVSVLLCTKRGLFKSISGLAGTIIGFIGARMFSNAAAKPISSLIEPIFKSIFSNEKIQQGLSNFAEKAANGITNMYETLIENGVGEKIARMLSRAFSNTGGSVVEVAEKYADGTLTESLAASAARDVAPIIAFIILFIVIKLAVSLVCTLLSADIPLVRTLNHLGGFLLGIISGLLIVILLCWGVKLFTPEDAVGFFSMDNLKNSVIGGFITKIFL